MDIKDKLKKEIIEMDTDQVNFIKLLKNHNKNGVLQKVIDDQIKLLHSWRESYYIINLFP